MFPFVNQFIHTILSCIICVQLAADFVFEDIDCLMSVTYRSRTVPVLPLRQKLCLMNCLMFIFDAAYALSKTTLHIVVQSSHFYFALH